MKTPELKVDREGTKRWYIHDNLLHREDGPAVVFTNGDREWWANGKRHRNDGLAIERVDGTKQWYLNGELHRTDGHAIEYPDGTKYWYIDGRLHREDGPAIVFADGYSEWWLNDKNYDTLDEYAKDANWTGEQIVEWKLTHTQKSL